MIKICKSRWNLARHLPGVSLLLVVAAVAILFSEQATLFLQYERTAVRNGELWRLLSCHLTHWNFDHLFWDAFALLVIGFLAEPDARKRYIACILTAGLLIPVGIWLLKPDVTTYRGLSGIDSAVFMLLAVTILLENLAERQWFWVWASASVLVGFSAKVAYEQVTGMTLFVDSATAGMVPITLSHTIGGIAGVMVALGGWWSDRKDYGVIWIGERA